MANIYDASMQDQRILEREYQLSMFGFPSLHRQTVVFLTSDEHAQAVHDVLEQTDDETWMYYKPFAGVVVPNLG